jgi:putative oxidoreductase
VLAIIFELGGGLMLLFNWRAALAVDMLIAFTVAATIIGHTTFTGDAMKDQAQYTMILKNLAIVGGLLLMARHICHHERSTEMEAA